MHLAGTGVDECRPHVIIKSDVSFEALSAHWRDLDGTPTWEDIMRTAHRRREGLLIESDDIDSWIGSLRRRYRQQPRRDFESDLTDGRWMRVGDRGNRARRLPALRVQRRDLAEDQ